MRNDDSIVLQLRSGAASVVLTSEIGREIERTLAAAIPPSPLRVIKVPHQGSLTSCTSEFIRALGPQVAIVIIGRGNHFGHPAPEVLEPYGEVWADIFRADRHGAVTVDTDGMSVDVRTFTAGMSASQRRAQITMTTQDAKP